MGRHSIAAAQPFPVFEMDIIKDLPETSTGHNAICSIIDSFSRYAVLYACHTENAKVVKTAYWISMENMVALKYFALLEVQVSLIKAQKTSANHENQAFYHLASPSPSSWANRKLTQEDNQ